MCESWSREEWKARLKEIGLSPLAFAVAAKISSSTLNKLFGQKPVHQNTLDRVEETYLRLKGESRAVG